MKMKKVILAAVCAAVVVTASAWSGYAAGLPERILDMTYAYDENTIYWPNATPFKLTPEFRGMTERGYWYAANFYAASEHGGTHADAPLHFAKNGRTIDQIPLAEWIGPAVKIDVTAAMRPRPGLSAVRGGHQKMGEKIRPDSGGGLGDYVHGNRHAILSRPEACFGNG